MPGVESKYTTDLFPKRSVIVKALLRVLVILTAPVTIGLSSQPEGVVGIKSESTHGKTAITPSPSI